jgi:hypothetical protein
LLEIEKVETHTVESQENMVYFAEGTAAPNVRHCRCKSTTVWIKKYEIPKHIIVVRT